MSGTESILDSNERNLEEYNSDINKNSYAFVDSFKLRRTRSLAVIREETYNDFHKSLRNIDLATGKF